MSDWSDPDFKFVERKIQDGMFTHLPDDYDPPLWDPTDIEPDETIMFLGQRRSGKSTMAEEIALKNRRLWPIVFCMTATAHNNFWQQVLPADKVVDGLDEELLDKLLELGANNITQWRLQKANDGSASGNPAFLLLNEDLLSGRILRKSKVMQKVVFNGRHYGAGSWNLVQDFVGMDRAERKNIDRFIIFRAFDAGTRLFIRQSWGDKALKIFENVTKEPFTALVINNKTNVPVEQVLMKYKTDIDWLEKALHKNLRLGNLAMWEDIDLAEQKKQYPLVEKLSRATLEARFNEPIVQEQEPPEETSLVSLSVFRDSEPDYEKPEPVEKAEVSVEKTTLW